MLDFAAQDEQTGFPLPHTIYGYVRQPDGATPAADVSVTVRNLNSGVTLSTTTTSQGYYQATPDVADGDTIEVRAVYNPLPGSLTMKNVVIPDVIHEYATQVDLQLLPVYELSMTPAYVAQDVLPGDAAAYLITLHNTGNMPDTFDLSSNPPPTSDWQVDHPVSSGFIPPYYQSGNSVIITLTVTSPADAVAYASATIQLAASSVNAPGDDYTVTTVTTVKLVIGIELTTNTPEKSVYPGDDVTYTLQVANTGNWYDEVLLACIGLQGGWTVDYGANPVYLDPWEIESVTLTIHTTALPEGRYPFTVTASSIVNPSLTKSLQLVAVLARNVPPVADAGPDKNILEGQNGYFDGSASYDSDGIIVSYSWDFGDSGTGTGKSVYHAYGDNGVYTVILTIIDDDGAQATDSITVVVLNVAPTISPFGPFNVNEGTSITASATATDPGSDDLKFTWSWEIGPTGTNIYYNNGVGPDPYPSPWGTFPFTVADSSTYTYGDNYGFTLILQVCDDDGGCSTYSTAVTVHNVNPTIQPFGPFTVNEGSSLTATASAWDVGSDDLTFTWTWQLGPTYTTVYYNDGMNPDQYPSPWGTHPFGATGSSSHVYGDNYDFTLTLKVCDDDGGCTTYSALVHVLNIVPNIQPFGPFTVNEGSQLTVQATAGDVGSDDLTFTWIWQLGSTVQHTHYNDGLGSDPYPSPSGTFPFSVTDTSSLIYGDNNPYILTLKVCDDDGGCTTYSTTVTVLNVNPTIQPFGPFEVNEGSPLTVQATANDVGSDDLTFTWKWQLGPTFTTIYYNDGVGPDPYPSPWGTLPFTATDSSIHAYGDNYDYILTLQVCDDDGGCTIYSTTVVVHNVDPTIQPFGPFTVDEGSSLTVTATASDVGSDDLKFTWIWQLGPTDKHIYYDDGMGPDSYPSPWGTFPFSVMDSSTYTYGDNYDYTLTLRVCDDDGGCTTYSTIVNILNVNPTIQPFGPFTVDEGSSLTSTATASDVGSDDLTFTWTWQLGPTAQHIYYNDGTGSDPYPSPWGTFPFSATDSSTHIYGDNYDFILTLKVCDDDGGCTTYSTTVYVLNVVPTIQPFGPFDVNEGSPLTVQTTASDVGSDDLTFTWTWQLGSTVQHIHFNDGVGPDPYPSPSGTFPFSATDSSTQTYGDNYPYTLTLQVCDDDGGCTTYSTIVTVHNVDPTIQPFGPFTVDEGSPLMIQATASDVGSDDLEFTWVRQLGSTFTIIYYNNGVNPDPYPSPWGTFPFSITDTSSLTYGDNYPYALTLKVCDDDGGCTTYSTTVTVLNVNPTIQPFGPFEVDEGSPLTVQTTANDAGSDDLTFTWTWQMGPVLTTTYYNDGVGPDPYPSPWGTFPFSATGSSTHTYGDNYDFVLTLEVCDDDGGCATYSTTVVVHNVDPTIKPFGPFTVDEGSSVTATAVANDVGSDDLKFTWTWQLGPTDKHIYYDDGMGPDPYPSPWGTFPFTATGASTHIYGDNYPYTLTLQVCDDDGGCTTYSTTVTVLNVNPSIQPFGPYTIDEGDSITAATTASDVGSDDLTFTWTWQLGSAFATTYYNNGVSPDPYPSPWGTFPFTATDSSAHTYGDNYDFTVTLKVCDDDGGCATYSTVIHVLNVVPTIQPFGPYTVDEGSPLTAQATADDVGSDDLTFTWSWGYGPTFAAIYYNNGVSPDPYPSPNGTFPFSATDISSHTYGDNYAYTLTLKVCDDDGGCTTYSTTVNVLNVKPTIQPFGPFDVNEGSPLTAQTAASDVGSDDLTFTWTWQLGPTFTVTYYNNGVSPDPYPSPNGTFPFSVTGSSTHIYGDNYDFTLTLKVCDDDGGCTTYSTIVVVHNVNPTIQPFGPFTVDEGSPLTVQATSDDPGSDDLTFTWTWQLGPTVQHIYYNDGIGPDPYPSPWGTFPFSATDTASHTYGDNYPYTLTLQVCDDDGGCTTYSTTVNVLNVNPTIQPFGPFDVDEGSPLTVQATANDVGSDDLTFTWTWQMGPVLISIYYNDGIGPDPYPSPWGTFPFTATGSSTHTYGDNYDFILTLQVCDDDGGCTTYSTIVVVHNVNPTIDDVQIYVIVNVTLRVAGEKWHDVCMNLVHDGVVESAACVYRLPGSPNDQSVTIVGGRIQLLGDFYIGVYYTPDDDPINGRPNGADPAWVTITFPDGSQVRWHHIFNYNHPKTWTWIIRDFRQYLVDQEITYNGTASDVGSDDLTFTWSFGDGSSDISTIYFNNGVSPDPYPSPEVNPITVTDVVKHIYHAAGDYQVTLKVMDDDGGTCESVFSIGIG